MNPTVVEWRMSMVMMMMMMSMSKTVSSNNNLSKLLFDGDH
jgi:hypothetical protein